MDDQPPCGNADEWQEGELAATLPLGTGVAAATHEVTLMVRGLNEFQARWRPCADRCPGLHPGHEPTAKARSSPRGKE